MLSAGQYYRHMADLYSYVSVNYSHILGNQMAIAMVNYSFILTWVDVGKSVFGLVVR